ncbi:iron ABC transporter permease [Salimicrobium jeotgali]|uniref:Iron ABC transporter permease n=1 Tax=Salimicrobium jeotgali TaxID=1230341 RepID=K2H6T8_9BACI|nr:iron chelate uptake ABC transporter family permease subunit [Salimicrobium jeotgali]AKG03306.1 iron ABC transporter permease [Salimicrobium jeotgali]EKE31465.1 iron-siderophore ABC transporter permease [Salimicrobium jeotgali]MBM7696744.1 iron complex transport system permease protein [Salimicrobium jeotgali]
MGYNKKLIILLSLSVASILLFVFWDVGGQWDYVLPRRLEKVAAITMTGAAIAASTVIFQTITNNRILTPSLIGFDSLYVLLQTAIVFLLGGGTLVMMNNHFHFLLSVGLMVVFALLLFLFIFKREGKNIYFLLLVGIILGTFFSSVSDFLQVLIDPNEFLVVQDKMFASFNNANTELLLVGGILLLAATLYLFRYTKYLDVISLGEEEAVNLGVNYDAVVKRLLGVIAVYVSVATALVGPITFLGLIVANVSHEVFRTYRHKYLIPGAIFVSIFSLLLGQWFVEHVFTFSTTISVIVNFVGGIYFIYLLVKENDVW